MILEGYFAVIDDYPEDEMKLCVARSYPFFVEKDRMVHYPSLAPSMVLLRGYKSGELPWKEYSEIFKDEMSQDQPMQSLGSLKLWNMEDRVIRLLCWEKAEDKRCHRFLLLDILSSMEEK